MHPVTRAILLVAFALGAALLVFGCKKKASQAECDTLIDRFATLVVKERIKDAPPELIKQEQERERNEAKGDDNFKNCTSEVQDDEAKCAMSAPTSEAFLKCLE